MDRSRVGWKCEECYARPKIHAARGKCGGPLRGPGHGMDGRPGAWTVEATTALNGSLHGPFGAHKFETCPLWEGNPEAHPWLDTLIRSWSRWKRFGWHGLGPSPTDALVDAVECLDLEASDLARVEADRAAELRQATARAKAQAARR